MDHVGIQARALTIESRWAWLAIRAAALGFAVVGFSCDEPPNEIHTSIALVDVTHRGFDFQIFRPPKPLVCADVAADPESLLQAKDFGLDGCPTLEPFDLVPLDLGSFAESDYDSSIPPDDVSSKVRACDAVVLRAPGLDDTVIFWNQVPHAAINVADDLPLDSPNIAYLNAVGDHWFVEPPAAATTWTAGFAVFTAPCSILR